MNKRKARGRITEEEANELFQKPLELLHRPPSSLDLVPVSSQHDVSSTDCAADDSSKHHIVGNEQPAAQVTGTQTEAPAGDEAASPTADSTSRPGVFQTWRFTAKRIWQATVRRPVRPASPASASTSDLTARLEENLLEASRLAAELQKRHQEGLTDHQRAISEIRDMVTLLVDQVARPSEDNAASSTAAPSAQTDGAQPQDLPTKDRPPRAPRRSKRGSRAMSSAEENAG